LPLATRAIASLVVAGGEMLPARDEHPRLRVKFQEFASSLLNHVVGNH